MLPPFPQRGQTLNLKILELPDDAPDILKNWIGSVRFTEQMVKYWSMVRAEINGEDSSLIVDRDSSATVLSELDGHAEVFGIPAMPVAIEGLSIADRAAIAADVVDMIVSRPSHVPWDDFAFLFSPPRPQLPSTDGLILQFGNAAANPADASTYYVGSSFATAMTATGGINRMYIPRPGRIKKVYLTFVNTTPGSNEASTIYVRLNNATDTTISTAVDNSGATQAIANAALSIAVAAGDYVEIKWITPTWITNPLGVVINGIVYME